MELIDFRESEDHDFDWLIQLHKESYHEVVLRQFGEWDDEFQRNMFVESRKIQAPKIILFNGADAGAFSFEHRANYDWIQDIELTTQYRNKGIGTAIIKNCISQARNSAKPLRLQVLHRNESAQRLYNRLGFVQINELEHHYLYEIL